MKLFTSYLQKSENFEMYNYILIISCMSSISFKLLASCVLICSLKNRNSLILATISLLSFIIFFYKCNQYSNLPTVLSCCEPAVLAATIVLMWNTFVVPFTRFSSSPFFKLKFNHSLQIRLWCMNSHDLSSRNCDRPFTKLAEFAYFFFWVLIA